MGMVQSTMGMFSVFAGFGLGATATKYIAEFRYKDNLRASRIGSLTVVVSMITAGFMMLLFSSLSPWLAEKTLNRSELTPLLMAGSLLLFVSTLGGVLSAVLAGFEAFREIAKINVWQGLAAPVVTLPLVWMYGVQGAIASFTINAAIGLLLCAIAISHETKKHSIAFTTDPGMWQEWYVLWKFSLPSMVSSLTVGPVLWASNTILANQPGGYGELGLFNAANQWRMVVIFLPGLLSSAVLPILSEMHGKEDKTDFLHTVVINFRMTWICALPLTVLAITIGKPLAILFGKSYLGATPIISILMLSVFLNVLTGSIGSALTGAGRMWIGTLMNFAWGIILLVSALVFVPRFGGVGLALSNLLAYCFHTAWVLIYVEKKLAPTAISNHWKLIVFSIAVLTASLLLGLSGSFVVYNILLLVVSLLPAAIFIVYNKRSWCAI